MTPWPLRYPPAFSTLAERSARKLRMSGVRAAEPPVALDAASWRALISPVDGAGVQVTWLLSYTSGQETGSLLTVVTRDPEGIVACFGSNRVPAIHLPPVQPLGSIHIFEQDEAVPALQLLESEFDAGRHVVRAALERHWAAGTLPTLEYRYFNPLLWNAEPLGAVVATPEAGNYSPAQIAGLLDHPVFAGWFWRDDAMFDAARRLKSGPSASRRAKQIDSVAAAHFDTEVVASYQRRLEATACWLARAAQPEAAAMAMSAAATYFRQRPGRLTICPPPDRYRIGCGRGQFAD